MRLSEALTELLASLDAGGGTALFGFDLVQAWDEGVLEALNECGLLVPAGIAQSIECHGCEERCLEDVVTRQSPTGTVDAFVVCHVADKQAEMGRIPIRAERLQQWRSGIEQLADFLASSMGIERPVDAGQASSTIRLGMLKGPNGRRWVSLSASPLTVSVNQQVVPVNELVFAESGKIAVDLPRIQHLLNLSIAPTGKDYVPNVDRREARKRATQAMYQDWQDAYTKLLESHPGRNAGWYARRIERMDIANGRNWETIRKRLR